MVELHSYHHPKATRKNLPTDQTERFMEPEDYEEQSLTPDRMDNTNHPVLQWEPDGTGGVRARATLHPRENPARDADPVRHEGR